MLDEVFFRGEVESYIDKLYLSMPLLKRHRDSAAIHILRVFEDSLRFIGMSPFEPGNREVQFHGKLRWAHEAVPWALRWVWRDCPITNSTSLDLDWTLYEEAVEIMDLGFKYYQLCRCFVLHSRGFFRAETIKEQKRVRFSFRSDTEERRDAVSMIYEVLQDHPPLPPEVLRLSHEIMLIVGTILPHYIDKTGEFSIKCDTPPDMMEYFKRWATSLEDDMRFNMPGAWQFGDYSLNQFRAFWKGLLVASVAHVLAHQFADKTVGTKGGAIGSLVMQMDEGSMMKAGALFSVPAKVSRSIFNALVYQPTRNYWDPFWQPIIKTSDGMLLIAPHLIITSSAERNLMTLLTRSTTGRAFYDRVSSQKEKEQLDALEKLFRSSRYVVRSRVSVPRDTVTTLTDIDLFLYDKTDDVLLLVHAKWLIRPDTVQEVLARNMEVQTALQTAAIAAGRIVELGKLWISSVLGLALNGLPRICSVVVSRDFIPSGWVCDQQIPVVNANFVTQFVGSTQFTGLAALYAACSGFVKSLEKKHPIRLAEEEIQFGEYVFHIPTIESSSE